MLGFVIGNGESRIGYDLNKLRPFGPIYGCNALYRDFIPDVLVAVDVTMIKEIQEKIDGGELVVKDFIYRSKNGNGKILKSSLGSYNDSGYAAGPTALKVLCERHPEIKEVFLVGFDLYSESGRRNNVYKSTPCYADASTQPVYPTNWIEKLARIFVIHEKVRFYRVTNLEHSVPEWDDVNNIFRLTYTELDQKLLKEVPNGS